MPNKCAPNSRKPFVHKARKRFGQNFLVDQSIIDRIVTSISPKTSDQLIEIGPGQGAITRQLLDSCPSLQVIELDRDLVPILLAQFATYPDFIIHQQDALTTDFSQLKKQENLLRIVGNLPYNISTPLIFHLLSFHQLIADMHFMLQKEVVERMAAAPGDKNYGRLSVMVQYHCNIEHLFDVAPTAFDPQPKVDSAIIRLQPYQSSPYTLEDIEQFQQLVAIAFQQRRKTLRNNLKSHLNLDTLAPDIEALGISLSQRPETLSISDYVNLSNCITQNQK